MAETKVISVSEFFQRYVNHADDCEKGITSPVCTCGLMQSLPHILVLALEAEKEGITYEPHIRVLTDAVEKWETQEGD